MTEKTPAGVGRQTFGTKSLVTTAMLMAVMVVMMLTPLGTIRLPVIAITIAHIPILVAVMTLGLAPGFLLSLVFGVTSLLLALLSPTSVTDPLFINPLVSILPRALIPFTTYFCFLGLRRLLGGLKGGEVAAITISVAVGNLTNTFGVYSMLYLVYAQEIFELTGTPALTMIVTALSTTTIIKCIGVMVVSTPIIVALRKLLKYSW